MYNTKIICKYNTVQLFLETDKITDEEMDLARDDIYRQEFLDIFGIKEYDESIVYKVMNELYLKIKNCTQFKECMLKMAGNLMSIDEEVGLIILFSYDYMHLTHICISEFLENNKISEINMNNLKNVIF